MKFEMHTKIISNEKEVRLHIEENIFQLILDGYHEWENGKTIINYQLVSLKSVN
jgi:hypothetical protein